MIRPGAALPVGTVETFDVVVVGAGPAGSSSALHLARRGHRVLLVERSEFPRDKACGDGLTRDSVDLLLGLGLGRELEGFLKINGLRLHHRGVAKEIDSSRIQGEAGLVVPRRELDALLARRAASEGALLLQRTRAVDLMFDEACVAGVVLERAGKRIQIRTRLVVAADGAHSRIAARAGLRAGSRTRSGTAMRGYYDVHAEVSPDFHVFVPLPKTTPTSEYAGYGWVFPVRGTIANVGVGFFSTSRDGEMPNLREVFDGFLARLTSTEGPFERLEPIGRLRGGSLVSDHDPGSCHGRGVALVGDAAGLVDPFTGEGIYAALRSGELAARALDEVLRTASAHSPDLSVYGRLLEEEFAERFRMGERFLRTYGFTRRIVEHTFECDGWLFDAARTAATNLGGSRPAGYFVASDAASIEQVALPVRNAIAAVEARFEGILRAQNPFLWKVASGLVERELAFRRLALFFACYGLGNDDDRERATVAATVMELCCLAFIILGNSVDEDEDTGHPRRITETQWANTFALMTGNCLLVEAYRMLSELEADVTSTISRVGAEYAAARMDHTIRTSKGTLGAGDYMVLQESMTGALFELAARLGSRFGQVPAGPARRLALAGRWFGMGIRAALDAEEVLRASPRAGSRNRIAERLRQREASYPFALTWDGRPIPAGISWSEARELMLSSGSVEATIRESERLLSDATRHLTRPGERPVRRLMRCLGAWRFE